MKGGSGRGGRIKERRQERVRRRRGYRVKGRMANARIKANHAAAAAAAAVAAAAAARNKFRRKEMRTVKYSRGMRKSQNDNAGCQPRTAVRLRAEHLSEESRDGGAARRRIKCDRYGQRRVEIRTYCVYGGGRG